MANAELRSFNQSIAQPRKASFPSSEPAISQPLMGKPRVSEIGQLTQNAERRTTVEKNMNPLVKFNLVEGKPIFDGSQEIFNAYADSHIEVSNPCPLSHGEGMPLAFEYFVKVKGQDKNAFFRIITKGRSLDLLTEKENEVNISPTFKAVNELLKSQQSDRRSVKPTVHWLMQPEEYYSLSAEGQKQRDEAIFSREGNSIIVNAVWTERIDTQHVVTPDSLEQNPQFWREAQQTINQYFNLQQTPEELEKVPLPFIKDKVEPFTFRGWEIREEDVLETNFPDLGPRQLYTLLMLKRDKKGNVVEQIRLLSAEPYREKMRNLKPGEYLPSKNGQVLANKERVCSDMWSRKGCECVKQMHKRVSAVLKEGGVMALLQLDKSMGYGTKVEHFEHLATAEEAGVLGTGKPPAEVAKKYKTTFPHRERLFGKKVKKDLTNYRGVARGLFEQMFGKNVTFKVLSDSDNKAGVYPIGPYSAGVKVEKHPIDVGDDETREEKNRFLGNNYNPSARRNSFAMAA